MDRLTSIVLYIVTNVVDSVVLLFDRLGAIPYMMAVAIFVALMRFIVLPLFDYGSTIQGISAEIHIRDGHVNRGFIPPAQPALPSPTKGLPRAGDPRN